MGETLWIVAGWQRRWSGIATGSPSWQVRSTGTPSSPTCWMCWTALVASGSLQFWKGTHSSRRLFDAGQKMAVAIGAERLWRRPFISSHLLNSAALKLIATAHTDQCELILPRCMYVFPIDGSVKSLYWTGNFFKGGHNIVDTMSGMVVGDECLRYV